MPKKGFFVPSKGLFVPLQKRRRFNYLIYVCKVGKERVTLLPLLFFYSNDHNVNINIYNVNGNTRVGSHF